jgi:hypothetical protein
MRRIVLLAGATAMLAASVIYLAQERHATAQTNDQIAISDLRSPIALTDNESAFIRHEMRGLLESVRDILEASEAGDRARVAAVARRSGMNGPEATHIPKSLAPKLPPEFKKLGLATHRGFDQIALDAEQIGSADLTLKQLVQLMGNCLGCHAAWRLVDESKR